MGDPHTNDTTLQEKGKSRKESNSFQGKCRETPGILELADVENKIFASPAGNLETSQLW